MAYAEGTKLTVHQSQTSIIALLAKHGITKHAMFSDGAKSALTFERAGVVFHLAVAQPDPKEFADPTKLDREVCRRWRCLVLGVKAKLVMVQEGITTMEREFLADVATPGGGTVGDHLVPEIRAAVEAGRAPVLALPGMTR